MLHMQVEDPEVAIQIDKELQRQKTVINLIPSENYVSKAVLEACGTVLMNKYSEGYPLKRYYQGNEFIDNIELLAIERAKKLFGAEHVNLQPYSGSPANQAVFHALLKPGDKIMGMRLDMGGHLTHGHSVNFSARYYNVVQYGVRKDTEYLDMEEIRQQAIAEKPQIIVCGATAYPRTIDFKKFGEIAREVGAFLLADISHIAGLVAAGVHPSPFPHADVVMTTTHKTLRGPRGAMIMCKEKHAAAIDKAVFPGLQGGPHDNITAAKAVAFREALSPAFKDYAKQIVNNSMALAETLMDNGIKLVTNGSENHLLLLDLRQFGIGLGKKAAVALENAGMCTNCNTVPYDPSTPFKPSGVRIGTPIVTTRGMRESEMKRLGKWMADVIKNMDDTELHARIKKEVETLCKEFPFY